MMPILWNATPIVPAWQETNQTRLGPLIHPNFACERGTNLKTASAGMLSGFLNQSCLEREYSANVFALSQYLEAAGTLFSSSSLLLGHVPCLSRQRLG
jgi:hypothetical protein